MAVTPAKFWPALGRIGRATRGRFAQLLSLRELCGVCGRCIRSSSGASKLLLRCASRPPASAGRPALTTEPCRMPQVTTQDQPSASFPACSSDQAYDAWLASQASSKANGIEVRSSRATVPASLHVCSRILHACALPDRVCIPRYTRTSMHSTSHGAAFGV